MSLVAGVMPLPRRGAFAATMDGVLHLTFLVTVATLPLMGFVDSSMTPTHPHWFGLYLTDVVMWVVSIMWLFSRARRTAQSPLFAVALLFVGALCVAYLAHPSAKGVLQILRVFSAFVAADLGLQSFRSSHGRSLVNALASVMAFEVVLQMAQWLSGAAFRTPFQYQSSVWPFGNALAPAGTTQHPYMLTALSFVCVAATAALAFSEPVRLLPLRMAVAIAPAVMTYSRSSVVAVVLLLATLLLLALIEPHRRGTVKKLALGIVIGVVCFGTVFHDGWFGRASGSGSSGPSGGNGRVATARQALALFERSPILGVGPGNFVETAERSPRVASLTAEQVTVHNVVLAAITESGIVGLFAIAALVALFVRRIWRRPTAWVVLAAVTPFAMLDQTNWVHTPNAVALGLALGSVIAVSAISPRSETQVESLHSAGEDVGLDVGLAKHA